MINHLGYGGSERQLFLVLSSFDPGFSHRVVVFNPSPGRVYDEALEAAGVEVCRLPAQCRGVRRRLIYLARRLRSWRPDVVHSWTVHDNPYAGLAGLWAGVPVRWGSLRGSLHSEGLRRQGRLARGTMLRSVQRIVVNSRELEEQLVTAGVPRSKTLLLPNCVRPQAACEPADLTDLGISAAEKVVGIVGNLRAVKNHGLFVRAMTRVLSDRTDCRALIVGAPSSSEPETAAGIVAEIERRGLSGRVILAGFRDDVPSILERLSVLCLTSRSEGQPNVVLEALAAGVPVVACRVGGVPELVDDGVEGFLVAPEDEAALASAVGRLLDDEELTARMRDAGRRRVSRDLGCGKAAGLLGQAYVDALTAAGARR
ncbi:MAG: glycosyltransferase [Thermoanaerobaculia bacterium]|nr:glycosyltransferase [Thermoanaerobaculia bacterium]